MDFIVRYFAARINRPYATTTNCFAEKITMLFRNVYWLQDCATNVFRLDRLVIDVACWL